MICSHCLAALNRTQLHKDQPGSLHQRFFQIPNLQYALAFCWFQKGTVIQKLLHQLKYEGNDAVGHLLGELYGQDLADYGYANRWDYITSVPLHYKKLRKRGYNQSDVIGKGLNKALNVPYLTLLKKQLHRKSQTRKRRLERFANVEETFSLLQKAPPLKGKHVVIVDDVLTTGATIQAACQPLIKAGAKVSVLVIAAVRA